MQGNKRGVTCNACCRSGLCLVSACRTQHEVVTRVPPTAPPSLSRGASLSLGQSLGRSPDIMLARQFGFWHDRLSWLSRAADEAVCGCRAFRNKHARVCGEVDELSFMPTMHQAQSLQVQNSCMLELMHANMVLRLLLENVQVGCKVRIGVHTFYCTATRYVPQTRPSVKVDCKVQMEYSTYILLYRGKFYRHFSEEVSMIRAGLRPSGNETNKQESRGLTPYSCHNIGRPPNALAGLVCLTVRQQLA